MDLVKLKFLKNGKPVGKEYTYISNYEAEVGDNVVIDKGTGKKGIITEINVPVSEVENYKGNLKEIVGKVCETCETCEHLIALGEGDHLCGAGEQKVVLMDYEPAEDYMWCGGDKYKEN
jgi:hypothetical protein